MFLIYPADLIGMPVLKNNAGEEANTWPTK
jgi:hypothetical protein